MMNKVLSRQKHRSLSNNAHKTKDRKRKNELPSPPSALQRMQQPHIASPEDLLTLQNSVGNRAVEDIRPQTQIPYAHHPSLGNLISHPQTNATVIQRNDDQAPNLYAERNYLRITNEQQRQIESFASRAQNLIAPWGQLRQSVSGGGIDYTSYMNRLQQIKRQLNKGR